MNPSDTETSSSSTSSSSVGPGEHVTPTPPPHAREEERSSIERARSASTPPSYLRETGSGGTSRCAGALVLGRYGEWSEVLQTVEL